MTRRWMSVALAVFLGVSALTGCAAAQHDAADEPRALTQVESELLATSRWRNFDAGTRTFTMTVAADGESLAVTGRVDFATHTGTAQVGVEGSDAAQQIAWDGALVRVHPTVADDDPVEGDVAPSDSPEWRSRPLDARVSAMDAILLVLLSLGAEQPENPLLLQQSGARWIRTDTVASMPVDVFAIPPTASSPSTTTEPTPETAETLRVWADATGLMHRAEVLVGAQWITVDFDAAGVP